MEVSNKFVQTSVQPNLLSLLTEHKFKLHFQDTVNSLCSRTLEQN